MPAAFCVVVSPSPALGRLYGQGRQPAPHLGLRRAEEIRRVLDRGGAVVFKVAPCELELRLALRQGLEHRREAKFLPLARRVVHEAALAELAHAAAPGVEHALLLLRRHALRPAGLLELLARARSLAQGSENDVRKVPLPLRRQHPVGAGIPPVQGAPLVFAVVLRADEEGQVALRKDVDGAAEGPVLHQAVRRGALVEAGAAYPQRVQGVRHELRLHPAEAARRAQLVLRGDEALTRESAEPYLLSVHQSGARSPLRPVAWRRGHPARAERGFISRCLRIVLPLSMFCTKFFGSKAFCCPFPNVFSFTV